MKFLIRVINKCAYCKQSLETGKNLPSLLNLYEYIHFYGYKNLIPKCKASHLINQYQETLNPKPLRVQVNFGTELTTEKLRVTFTPSGEPDSLTLLPLLMTYKANNPNKEKTYQALIQRHDVISYYHKLYREEYTKEGWVEIGGDGKTCLVLEHKTINT